MGKFFKGEDTLQSQSIHGSWTQFPEMFWSIRQISTHLSYKGVQMLAFRCNHVQINAGNTSKGAPAVTSRLSNGQELSKAAALCIPMDLPPNPFLSILIIPFSVGPMWGHRQLMWWGDAPACGGCGVVLMWGHISLHTSLWSRAVRIWELGELCRGGHALPATRPELGEHGI